MRNVKKCLALLLSVIMILSLFPVTAAASEEGTEIEFLPEQDLSYDTAGGIVGDADFVPEGDELYSDYPEEQLVGASNISFEYSFQYGQTEARTMLDMVNDFRTGPEAWYWDEDNQTRVDCPGLSELTYDYQLEKVAMLRAREVAILFSHTRPDGTSCGTALDELGYSWWARGENLAGGFTTAEEAYIGLREDEEDYDGQGHRRNMLYQGFTRIGIGHVIYNGIDFWTQIFARSDSEITYTEPNESIETASTTLSDEFIDSAEGYASVDSLTVSVNKSCELPSVTLNLKVCEPGDEWKSEVEAVTECEWTSEDNNIAYVGSDKLNGAAIGTTTISTTVGNVTISVPVTVEFEPIVVGDNVTAEVILDGGIYKLYFNSQNGTLWSDWQSKIGSVISNINTIEFDSASGKLYLPADSSSLFSGMSELASIDLSKADTSLVTNVKDMFSGCSSLETLDLSEFDLSAIREQENADDMFKDCSSLTTIDAPKKTNATVNIILPATFIDDNCNQFVRLPVIAFSSITITKYDPDNLPVIDLSKCTVTLSESQFTYNGSERKAAVNATHRWTKETLGSNSSVTTATMNDRLQIGTDFTASYSNNINAGTANVTITGIGRYEGTIRRTFRIIKAPPYFKFESNIVTKTNIDDPFTNKLTIKTDGTVSYISGNTAVATVDSASGEVTIKGIGTTTITVTATYGKNYLAGSAQYTLRVIEGRTDISQCSAKLDKTVFTYNGSEQKPSATVTYQGKTLQQGTDYTLDYSNNVNVGEATATVTGAGKYMGSVTLKFKINQAAPTLKFASASMQKTTLDAPFTNTLTKKTDGTITFKSSDAGVATVDETSGEVTIKGIGTTTITVTATAGTNYKAGSASYTLEVVNGIIDIADCDFALNPASYTYNGSARKPAVTVTYQGKELAAETDYNVAYSKNVNAGTASVTVTGINGYTGNKVLTFKINKANPTLKFASTAITKNDLDKPFTNKLSKKTDGTVTYKSSNTKVATVNSKTGEVTIKGVGTTTITAAAAAGKNYKAKSISYTLKVTKKDIIPVYRLFNTRTGEHFYTASTTERSQYLKVGTWRSEGVAWYAPRKSSEPIYRLSNPNNGNEHHYTKSLKEKDWLVGLGWRYDCIAWYSDTDKLVPIYRHYHPIQRTGNHHYTTSKGESNHIVKYEGWKYEGISFYVSKAGG